MTTAKLRTATFLLAVLAVAGCAKTPAIQSKFDAERSVGPPLVTSTTAKVVANEVNVTLGDFTLTASQTSVPAGKYHFDIANNGKIQHELLVFRSDLAPSALPMTAGNMNEEGAGVTKISDGDNLDPGMSQTREVDLSQPGNYLLICNLPGHLHAGMIKVLTVV